MLQGFWKKLLKPFFVLAPMEDVTDSAFRQIIAACGKPDVMFTEFVSAAGLCSPGREKLLVDLQFSPEERPLVAQIFGTEPEHFYQSARLLTDLGFDGIDVNMGCPDKRIMKQGSCAALIADPARAQAIIGATKEGAPRLPISVKTRIGIKDNVIETWIPALLKMEPSALTIHGRTAREMSKVPVHWDAIERAVQIRNKLGSATFILGNGDMRDLSDAREKISRYGLDGAMLGRAVFGNPWLFNRNMSKEDVSLQEILNVLLQHMFLFEKLYAGQRPFALMKKHFASYIGGYPGAKRLRARLMLCNSVEEVKECIYSIRGK